MFDSQAINALTTFFASPKCTTGFTIDRTLGVFTACASCSEFISEDPLLDMILGDNESEDNYIHFGDLLLDVSEQLALGQFTLNERYTQVQGETTLSDELIDWCSGYLLGYWLISQIWQKDFNMVDSATDIEDQQTLANQCNSTLNFIALLADLTESSDGSADTSTDIASLNKEIEVVYQLASRLKQIKIQQQTFEESHFQSQPVLAEYKPGRNDPCLCGSGKKYKKCCLK